MKLTSAFNKYPYVAVKGRVSEFYAGWQQIIAELKKAVITKGKEKTIITIETYQGVFYEEIKSELQQLLSPVLLLDTEELLKSEEEIRKITQPDVTDDRVFGYMTRLTMKDLMESAKLQDARQEVLNSNAELVLIFGYGAVLVQDKPDILIYADMARWEIQQRMQGNMVNNLGINNMNESIELKYKRGFFVDWRICDRLKKETMYQWDYVLDTNDRNLPKMAAGEAVREGLIQATAQPFSVVPFFDPGPWGGQWMKEKFGLNKETKNFAWCFNCVPEENSLLLGFGDNRLEIPSINVVLFQPRNLLGDAVYARFGDEFPIRFDFLDTMAGGNLSLQVHPLKEYIQDKFGMHYTQDESYYMMDAENDGSVYLGLKEGIDRDAMVRDLQLAKKEGGSFHVDKYIEKWPAKKHDHFMIPAGTVHCSGRNGMVLEISATPYIFTFKLYDWGRKNLDGKPRPINLEHGMNNIQWEQTRKWTAENLVNPLEKVAEGEGWTEERTGLHETEFIETRRHWFTGTVPHHTNNGVNVINLVEGTEVIVESPSNKFAPFIVHYAETFIVPAKVGAYTIRPHGKSEGKRCVTIKAFVRSNA